MTDPPAAPPPDATTRPLPSRAEAAPPERDLTHLWARLHYSEARLHDIERRLAWVETQVQVQLGSPEGTGTA